MTLIHSVGLPDTDTRATGEPGQPPASNTGATFSTAPRWDYSATTHLLKSPTGVGALVKAIGSDSDILGPGLQGWKLGTKCYDARGDLLGTIYHGGREDVHVVLSGGVTDGLREAVLAVGGIGGARTARVDTRVDTLRTFEDLAGVLEICADRAGMQVITINNRVRGVNKGRTVYIGAASSRIRVRLYEKWLESPGEYVQGTNRVEVQLRPSSSSKSDVSGWDRTQTFACSPMTRRLADMLGLDEGSPVALQSGQKAAPDLDRAVLAMGRQYGKTVRGFMARTGGDVSSLLEYLAVSESSLAVAARDRTTFSEV